jgi:DNA-binding response OmpR family regulator
MVPMHILVVDDDGDVRDTIVAMLRVHGYRVSSATEGWSMRDFLSGSDSVDGVVLDAVMPGEAGAGLALYAKELLLPVVMISGSQEAMQFAIENGLQLLEKPFRMQQLFDAIDAALCSGQFGQREA